MILVKMSRLPIYLSKRKNSRNYICLMEPLFSLSTWLTIWFKIWRQKVQPWKKISSSCRLRKLTRKIRAMICLHDSSEVIVSRYILLSNENQFWLTLRFNLDQDTLSQKRQCWCSQLYRVSLTQAWHSDLWKMVWVHRSPNYWPVQNIGTVI